LSEILLGNKKRTKSTIKDLNEVEVEAANEATSTNTTARHVMTIVADTISDEGDQTIIQKTFARKNPPPRKKCKI
jgi:hypothetical protein